MIYLETTRLLLRDWKEKDMDPFRRLNADERVMTYFPETFASKETNAFYKSIITEIKECGFGLFAVEEKTNKEFIGFIGFHRATFEADFTPCIEIGWRLKRSLGKRICNRRSGSLFGIWIHRIKF